MTCTTCANFIYFYFSEPETGFLIAFNMFDTDGNQRVDKEEFLVVSIALYSTYAYYLYHYRGKNTQPNDMRNLRSVRNITLVHT